MPMNRLRVLCTAEPDRPGLTSKSCAEEPREDLAAGSQVFAGDQTDEAGWERALRAALRGSYVVQEKVEQASFQFPILHQLMLRYPQECEKFYNYIQTWRYHQRFEGLS